MSMVNLRYKVMNSKDLDDEVLRHIMLTDPDFRKILQ